MPFAFASVVFGVPAHSALNFRSRRDGRLTARRRARFSSLFVGTLAS